MTFIFFQLGDESLHTTEITCHEKPLQIVDSIQILLRCTRDRLPGSFPCLFKALSIGRQRLCQLAIQNTFDISLVLPHSPGQRFNEMKAHRIQPIRTLHAQPSDLPTGITGWVHL